jgi:type IV secretion system protein VirB10
MSTDPSPVVGSPKVEGERTIPPVNTERSLQARVNTLLAVILMVGVGGAFLFWWFSSTARAQAETRARQAHAREAQSDSRLPPLGPVEAPTSAAGILGPKPPNPSIRATATSGAAADSPESADAADRGSGSRPSVLHRKLSQPVLYRQQTEASPPGSVPEPIGDVEADTGSTRWAALTAGQASAGGGGTGGIGNYLKATETVAVQAHTLPTQRFLLPKGSFVDCTLETALSSQLPGLATCITAFDIFGADGSVVLLERGSKLTGETKGETRAGMNRLFVLWTEARTPTGVVVELASPGTDELGRSGLPGTVDTHFWERFGAAILVTVIDGVVQAGANAAQSRSGNTSVELNPQNTSSIATEVLRNTIAIPPTIEKHQGDRIQILVARDVDFRSVYALRVRE